MIKIIHHHTVYPIISVEKNNQLWWNQCNKDAMSTACYNDTPVNRATYTKRWKYSRGFSFRVQNWDIPGDRPPSPNSSFNIHDCPFWDSEGEKDSDLLMKMWKGKSKSRDMRRGIYEGIAASMLLYDS
jgi:hypothetical protein